MQDAGEFAGGLVYHKRSLQWGQSNSLVAHLLLVPGDHGSNPGESFTLELTRDYAK